MSINNPRWFASSDAPRTSHQPGQYATLDRGNVDDNDNDKDSSTTTKTTTKTTTTTTMSSSKRPANAESLASKKKQRKLDFSKKDDNASLDPNRPYGAHVTDRAAPPTVESAATPQRGKDATSRTVHSYANVVFLEMDGLWRCQIGTCTTVLKSANDGSTSSRLKHVHRSHPSVFKELESAKDSGGNASAYGEILAKSRVHRVRQLTLEEPIPAAASETVSSVLEHQLSVALLCLQMGSSYAQCDALALRSFLFNHQLDSISQSTASSLVAETAAVVAELHKQSMSTENLLVNIYFDELTSAGAKWLGVTVSFAKKTVKAIEIERFPLCLLRITAPELTGLVLGNILRRVVQERVPSSATIASATSDNASVVQCAGRVLMHHDAAVELASVPPSVDGDGVNGCFTHLFSLLEDAANEESEMTDVFARMDYLVRFVDNHQAAKATWRANVSDQKARSVVIGGNQRWHIKDDAVEAFLRERHAYGIAANTLSGHDVTRMPSARDIQLLIDTRKLRHSVRALARAHESRTEPTMAYVVKTILDMHDLLTDFIDGTSVFELKQYGRAMRRQAERYFTPLLSPLGSAARAGFFAGQLPKQSYDAAAAPQGTYPRAPSYLAIREAIMDDFDRTFPPPAHAAEHRAPLSMATKLKVQVLCDNIASVFGTCEQEIKPLEFWFQVLSDMPLTEPRQKIRDMCREISHSANYVLGTLAVFSASVEPERLFRDVGHLFDGRESLAEEQIEAEAIVVDFMKTNASTEQSYCALVKQLAAGVQTHRKLAKEERRLARLRTAEEAASAAAAAAAEAARAAAAAKAIVDCDDEDEDADVDDK